MPLLLAGRASEVLRKFRNEVLPAEVAPMMRILRIGQFEDLKHVYDGDLLEWCWILPSSHSARTIDCADRTAGVTISATMCHAFRSGIWIITAILTDRDRRDWWVAS